MPPRRIPPLSPALLLRRALGAHVITVAFEPQEDRCRDAVAYEALARWPDTPMAPSAFITVAEEHGLIGELGRQVLDQALADTPCRRISVNLSPFQLVPGLVCEVEKLLTLWSSRLTFEVTEGHPVSSDGRRILHRLRTLGVRIALDDLGSGFATVEALDALELDQAKLDGSLVGENSRRLEELAAAVKARGLELVVEGIETEEQRDRALTAGADLLQGRLVSRRHRAEMPLSTGTRTV